MIVDQSVLLIFGGCCSNVFALEAIVKHEPDSGILITVTQLFLTALVALPSQVERTTPQKASSHTNGDSNDSLIRRLLSYRLRPTQIPFYRLTFMSLIFCAVNVLNNWAFAFNISVPMHIILRSFGSVTTLAVGWLAGKRYSRLQVASVLGLTVGVVVSAWADASAKGAKMDLGAPSKADSATSSFASGLIVLFIAQVLAAVMGIYTEQTYASYGRHWLENLFYTHFLGTIFSLAFWPSLQLQLSRLLSGPRVSIPTSYLSTLMPYLPNLPRPITGILESLKLPKYPAFALLARFTPWSGAPPSKSFLLLLVNAATQVICISGVNRLGARTSAVTVTVVLNVRKLASFLLSCFIFGNKLSGMMMVGAAIVFASGGVYGWDSSLQGKKNKKEKLEESEKRKSDTTAADTKDSFAKKDKENGTLPASSGYDADANFGTGVSARSTTTRRRGD